MTTSRTIVVGDIHGCFEELQTLLSQINFQEKDELISIGDLVDRGPNPREVVSFFMDTPNARAIMGNHEDKHLRIFDGELDPSFAQKICIAQLGSFYEKAIEYMRALPLYLKRKNFWLVHAGLLPNIHPKYQPKNTLLRGRMPWMKSNYDKSFGGWWKHYRGSEPVVFGHTFFRDVHIENNTYGLDTGVCHGEKLSAMILEDRTIIQVDASRDHWKILRETFSS